MKTTPETAANAAPKPGDLRVWWVPQVPMQPFTYPVQSVREAKLLLSALAKYDIFQLENHVKPDFCNAGGLSVFEDGGWADWYGADGKDIDETELD